jgi:hypothetical protein
VSSLVAEPERTLIAAMRYVVTTEGLMGGFEL